MIGFPPKSPRPPLVGVASKAPAPESSAPDPDVDPGLATAESSKRILLESESYRVWCEIGCPAFKAMTPAQAEAMRAAGALDVRRKIEAAGRRAADEEWRRPPGAG